MAWTVLGVAVLVPLLLVGVTALVIPMDAVVAALADMFGLGAQIDRLLPGTSG
jgi:hypothetical protein